MIKRISIVIFSLFLLVGCHTSKQQNDTRVYTHEEIMEGGMIDIEKAKQSGFMPYEDAADNILPICRNKKVCQILEEHHDDIVDIVKPYLESYIGQEVEILAMHATFPYMMANISYMTTSFPRFRDTVGYALGDNAWGSVSGIRDISEQLVQREFATEIVIKAYETEFNQFRADFAQTFPELIPDKIGSLAANEADMFAPFLRFNVNMSDEIIERLYNAYQSNKIVDRAEVDEILKTNDQIVISSYFHGIMRDETAIPTKELWHKVHDFVQNYAKPEIPNVQYSYSRGQLSTNYQKIERPSDSACELLNIKDDIVIKNEEEQDNE